MATTSAVGSSVAWWKLALLAAVKVELQRFAAISTALVI
jgi:hypothetical protein